MRILLSWLRDFVDIAEAPADLARALTMAGMAVDAVEEQDGETILEVDVTSNRPDALNHFGMAREVAALYRRPLRRPPARCEETGPAAAERASVAIEDETACPRYAARVFANVQVGPSPDWLRRRLELCGVRAINNLADLTNYVLLEIGQPTHAFDLDTLAGRRIVVRRARAGETLVTLDGEERSLGPEQLAICDAEKPVALAGVMGGAATEIRSETRNMLLEAAWFQPAVVRNASRGFKLFTEASHRFERGADWDAAIWATDRIAALAGQLGCATALRGRIDAYPRPRSRPAIRLERDRIRRCLGIEIGDADVAAILGALGFEPVADASGWTVPAVSHRLDVDREIDLVEEVGRIYGFDRIPATLPVVGSAPAETSGVDAEGRLRADARALGYDETIGFSFVSAKDAARFGGAPGVALRNPLSQVWSTLRNSSVPTMLAALERNVKRNQPDVRLAEFGRLYRRAESGYDEPRVLTLGACGLARPPSWADASRPFGFYDLKGDVAALLQPFALGDMRLDARGVPDYYRAGHAAAASAAGSALAYFGELEPSLARARKIRQPLFVAEIFLEPLFRAGLREPGHRPLPRVPAVTRDFSLLVPDDVPFARIRDAVGQMPDLASLEPVEIFRGENVPPGWYSLLLRAAWQRLDTSLTDAEANAFAEQLRSALQDRLGIRLRA